MTIHLRAGGSVGVGSTGAGSSGPRRAVTLVELLIAAALTLILVYAIAEFYAYIGPSVKDGRAMIDLVAQLRTATTRLAEDLDHLTVPMKVFNEDGVNHGYFEYREGNGSDIDANGNLALDLTEDLNTDGTPDFQANNWSTMVGDSDDFVGMTIRSDSAPFSGQVAQVDLNLGTPLLDPSGNVLTATGSSTTAEVAWWTSFSDLDGSRLWTPNEPRFLQRRQLLVAPELNQIHPGDATPGRPARYYLRINLPNAAQAHYELLQQCDVSVRPIAVAGTYVYFGANSLLDLTRRENRFMHVQSGFGLFPHAVDLESTLIKFSDFDGDRTQNRSAAANDGSQFRWVLGGTRLGEDRMLQSVLSFDIRVFDPQAPIRADNTEAVDTNGNPNDDAVGTVQPGDPGWDLAVANNYPIVGGGAYVDLFYNRYINPTMTSIFSDVPAYIGPAASRTAYLNALGATYDTWAYSYERDGVDQLGDGRFDLATNGFDDLDLVTGTLINGVDDPGERETAAPYAVPLRGVEIRLRVLEPTTRQVRQATVGKDFITE
jgi:hypothetical protein